MKKIISIFFLMIHGFSLVGSLVLFLFAAYQTNRFYESQAQKGLYNKNDLVEVKIPVSMPGITDWTCYEHISGQIQFEDVTYNYTQLKITQHALYLKCVPNYAHTRFNPENVINATGIKNVPVPKKEHVPHQDILILPCTDIAFYNDIPHNLVTVMEKLYRPYSQKPVTVHSQVPEQPPRSC